MKVKTTETIKTFTGQEVLDDQGQTVTIRSLLVNALLAGDQKDDGISRKSYERLQTCHEDLKRIVNEVIKINGVYILQGYRGEEEQNKAFNEGKSKLRFPNSKHNKVPSLAIDLAPSPLPDWENTIEFMEFAMVVIGVAEDLKIQIRWGGDWDMDGETEPGEWDYVHFELV